GLKVFGTRWTHLKMVVEVVTKLGTILDSDGIDIWLLNERKVPITNPYTGEKNRQIFKNIRTMEEVNQIFDEDPEGLTPLTNVTRSVIESKSSKKKSITIATDGKPNNPDGYDDVDNFIDLLKYRDAKNNRISILALTNEKNTMAWLD